MNSFLLLMLILIFISPIQISHALLSNIRPAFGPTPTTFTLPETVDLTSALVTTVSAETDDPGGLTLTLQNAAGATFAIFLDGVTPVGSNQTVSSDASAGPKTGSLTVTSFDDALRYDTDPATSSISVEIVTSEAGGGVTPETSTVQVTILNVNDEDVTDPKIYDVISSPEVEQNTVSIMEQTITGGNETLFRVTVNDTDFNDIVSPVTLELKPDYGIFDVDACAVNATYPLYQCMIYVRNTTVLDHEDVPVYEMKLVFTDGRSDVTASVTVSVANELDTDPSFESTNLPNRITLAENMFGEAITSTEVVYEVVGVNNDGTRDPADLNYRFVNNITNQTGGPLFTIDASTGIISRTTNELSYEDFEVPATATTPTFILEIEVFLTADAARNASSTLEVFVEDVCEPPYFLVPDQSFRFDENEPSAGDFWTNGGVDRTVVTGPASGYDLKVSDPDVPSNGSTAGSGHTQVITYSIGDFPNKDLFTLDCDGTGGLNYTLTSSPADFEADCALEWVGSVNYETLEQRPEFLLPIIVTDACGSKAELLINVAIRNANDLLPVFINTGTYDATISELSKRGTYITTVTAYDPDADPDTSISYFLDTVNNPSNPTTNPGTYWFYIETDAQDAEYSTTRVGKIYLKYPWDRDTLGDSTVLTVFAQDSTPTTPTYATGGALTNSIDITITFSDRNDNRPYIHTFWNRELPYNEINDYYMGLNFTNNVTSRTHNDLGVNNEFEFRFITPSLYFDINKVTGSIHKSDKTLVPYKRYDVFVVSYDLGTDPEVKYSPLGIVRIDAYERRKIHVIFHMGGITTAYFDTHRNRFVNIMNDLFSENSWAFRVYDYQIGDTGNLEVTLYALTSDITDQVRYMNVTKTYVQKGQLLDVTRADSSGTPADDIKQSTDGSGVLDDFNIVLVEPEYVDPTSSRNWWTETELGLFVIILIIVLGIVLIVALGVLLVWCLTRERLPPPPKLPKVVPKEEKVVVRTGPGPEILSSDDDEIVARPRNDAEMRGYDAVTGREYIANPITGERTWVYNEGDIY